MAATNVVNNSGSVRALYTRSYEGAITKRRRSKDNAVPLRRKQNEANIICARV